MLHSNGHKCRVPAGHAGDVLGGQWYIAGGGNNSAGCNDLVALDLSGLGGTPLVDTPALRWRAVATSEPRASIASEGLSITSLPTLGLLLAFGGYNGKYHNEVQVFRPGEAASCPAALSSYGQASGELLEAPLKPLPYSSNAGAIIWLWILQALVLTAPECTD